jgi:hypothetical protein
MRETIFGVLWEVMRTESLSTMSDRELVAKLEELLGEERRLTAAVLLHLGEVQARRLYLPAACSSMFVYSTRVLGMSEDQGLKRIQAARAMRRFPAVAAAVEEGRLHLTAVVRLAPHLTDDNVEALVAEASGKTKAEIEVLLARLAPRPDAPQRLERVAEQGELVPEPPGAAKQVVPEPPRPAADAARLMALAPERFALQVTIGEATQRKLLRAQALLRHQVPSGDLAEVLDRALDALLDKVEGRKFGRTRAPRAGRASDDGRSVPRAVRRQAVARDGMKCSFVADDGRRCAETGFLELDHRVPVAQGGTGSEENVRVLCRSHNQYEADRILGRQVVAEGRAAHALDDDLVAGLRRLGVTAHDARQAVAASRGAGTVEERLRSALGALGIAYASRGIGTGCREPLAEQRGWSWSRKSGLRAQRGEECEPLARVT